MSRRKTVKLNLPVVNPLIKARCRSNIVFCEKMGRPQQPTWVTGWNRRGKDGKPAPKNLPSPEEAARMCVLLQTTPEEILTEQADIDLVRSLIEQEREKGIKKDPIREDGAVSPAAQEILDFLDSASGEELADVIKYIRYLKSQRK